MVERQLRRRGIDDERVLAAMRRVPRELFVPLEQRRAAYADAALSIGHGQTISQPFVVAATCALLRPQGGERALDVGTGSGYAACVLAELGTSVVGVERIPELANRARSALLEAGHPDVTVVMGDGSLGVPEYAPYDVIAVAAAVPAIPAALREQLADGGRLVAPRGSRSDQRLVLVERHGSSLVEHDAFACRFVPLVGADAFSAGPVS